MKVSILTSVYNKGPWLSRWFDCVCSQTFRDMEIVVVDNASTDDSPLIIEEYAQKDSRIKVVTLKENIGPSGGYNTALDNATGEYLTLADADDYMDSDYIEKLYSAIIEEKADLSVCVNDLVFPASPSIHKEWPKEPMNIIQGEKIKYLQCQLLDELSDSYFGFHMPELGAMWIKMYKTSIIREKKIHFNNNLWIWCDFDFNLQYILCIHKVVYINTTVYHFYQSENSVTRGVNYNPMHPRRIILAIESISLRLGEIQDERLINAALKFYFLRMKDVLNYMKTNKSSIDYIEYHKVKDWLYNSEPIKKLFAAKDLPILKCRERLFLTFVKANKIKTAYLCDRIIGSLAYRYHKYIKK